MNWTRYGNQIQHSLQPGTAGQAAKPSNRSHVCDMKFSLFQRVKKKVRKQSFWALKENVEVQEYERKMLTSAKEVKYVNEDLMKK